MKTHNNANFERDIPTTLVGLDPPALLLHGPSKRYVDRFHWFSRKHGVIAEYTPTAENVKDHFGVFRGVDQIEAFGQGAAVSTLALLEWIKQKRSLEEMRAMWNMAFLEVGKVIFHRFLREGETFISIGQIQFYRFRQIVMSGRIYKTPPGLDLRDYFREYSKEEFLAYRLDKEFKLAAEIEELTGRMIKPNSFSQHEEDAEHDKKTNF